MPLLPAAFTAKKRRILDTLALPNGEYHDLSPKGSVDTAILPLIRDINASEGLVTTSSCAGRISVYLTGPSTSNPETGEGGKEHAASNVPGGKGGGRWLYVSHDPLVLNDNVKLAELFGLGDGPSGDPSIPSTEGLRLVRFQFEPMVCILALRSPRSL